jgi:hypothetical protein
MVDGVSVGPVTSYTFDQVVEDHTIQASFTLDTVTITASAGTNGKISPAGGVSVNYGGSQSFSITPYTGYQVADVLVDGLSVGPVSSYTFDQAIENHTIRLLFLWIQSPSPRRLVPTDRFHQPVV